MRFRVERFHIVLTYVGIILFVFGLLLLIPFFLSFIFASGAGQDVRSGTFAIPVLISLAAGAICRREARRRQGQRKPGTPEAMLTCVFGWIAVSAVGAIPFSYHLRVSYLDAYFEAMSGFTTTGITMLPGLDNIPRSLLLWRSMTQWIGGLGILTFFTALVYEGGFSHRLFGAESSKVEGQRIAPGMWNTLKILWLIYAGWTVLVAVALYACGMSFYDAVSHSLTCLATGGYSTHDASITYYEQAGYPRFAAIEYVLIVGMVAGGTNFLVHHRLIKGSIKALWDSDETRFWWVILGSSTLLVMGSRLCALHFCTPGQGLAPDYGGGADSVEATFRHSLFQVVAIATSTGYATRDIGSGYFTSLARQVFLVLMLIGACTGSTGGGLKVVRIVILWRLMLHQVNKALKPDSALELLLVDGRQVSQHEAHRTAGLLFAWLFLLLFGALTTTALSHLGPLESASGMFTVLGNVGPCYIPNEQLMRLHPVIKLVYIGGMLAGRLEITPVLILFSRRTWR